MTKKSIWFEAKKLSINEGKTKYTFFHQSCQKHNKVLKFL